MQIRKATQADYDGVWEIFRQVIQSGDTYTFGEATPKEDLQKYWFAPYMMPFVAVENDEIVGSYVIKPNQPDLGSHIANGSYIVHPAHRGKGIGDLLCKHSIQTAKKAGFLAMQFNIVVSSNHTAVKLWRKNGFIIIGTIPNGFKHSTLGFVDAFIMYRAL